MYDAVIFDNDGVIVGRTPFDALQRATWQAFDAAGVPDPDPDHVEAMTVGVSPDDVTTVCDRYDLDPAEFWRTRDRTASEVQADEARAGRKTPYEDLAALESLDAPLGIVSSNQQSTVDFVLDHFDIGSYFETAYGREPEIASLERRKPEPHYIDRALDDLGADTALFVGDNESDVVAAHNAGIDSAFIRRPHRTEFDLSVQPTYEVRDLHDLVGICSR